MRLLLNLSIWFMFLILFFFGFNCWGVFFPTKFCFISCHRIKVPQLSLKINTVKVNSLQQKYNFGCFFFLLFSLRKLTTLSVLQHCNQPILSILPLEKSDEADYMWLACLDVSTLVLSEMPYSLRNTCIRQAKHLQVICFLLQQYLETSHMILGNLWQL